MQTPGQSAAYERWVTYCGYVARRLRRAKLEDLAAPVEAASAKVKTTGRAWDDAVEAASVALADRDGADDDLDQAAQDARNRMAGRGVAADREAPYTLIFPQGIGYYIAAALDQETTRYTELKQRAEKHLPDNDEVRAALVPAITSSVAAFEAGVETVAQARRDAALALTDLDAAEQEAGVLMERTYGALMQRVGKRRAERFFPRLSRSKGSLTDDTEPDEA